MDNEIIGTYPQVEDAYYNCDIWEDPLFIDRITFQNAPSEVKIANAILSKNAELTDLISAFISGFSLKLLISKDLKRIFELSNNRDLQFIKSPVFYKNIKIENYYTLNPIKIDFDYIDFNKSEIFLMENVFNKVEKLDLSSYNSFNDYLQNLNRDSMLSVYIENYTLDKSKIKKDIFVLKFVEGGVQYIVSEHIRNIILENSITGIDFSII
ncbi:hypothetical protein [Muriicola sp.]|uniref:hypothetical protein n=1 Tax=Muriicola sp. TaxID=2020856 RepID=UPI003C73E93E